MSAQVAEKTKSTAKQRKKVPLLKAKTQPTTKDDQNDTISENPMNGRSVPISMPDAGHRILFNVLALMCGTNKSELVRELLLPMFDVVKSILEHDGFMSEHGTLNARPSVIYRAYKPENCSEAYKKRNHELFMNAQAKNPALAFDRIFRSDKVF